MDIGIGLPSTIPGAGRDEVLEWARRAEARGFSTLGTIDRIVYPGHEPLIALAAAAAVTERIRLATTILLAPTRGNGALLAKQAASLDALSGGRLVLGVAVGRREDDFRATGHRLRGPRAHARRAARPLHADLGGRGVRHEGRHRPAAAGGPPVAHPGRQRAARRSRGRRGTATAGAPATPRRRSWRTGPSGSAPRGRRRGGRARRGRWPSPTSRSATGPRRRSTATCATTTTSRASTWTRWWPGRPRTPRRCGTNVRAFAAAGCDEVIFFPCDADPDQVDRLADALE